MRYQRRAAVLCLSVGLTPRLSEVVLSVSVALLKLRYQRPAAVSRVPEGLKPLNDIERRHRLAAPEVFVLSGAGVSMGPVPLPNLY